MTRSLATTTVDHASLDDMPLDPSNFGQPVFSQGMAPTFDDSVFDTSAYGDAPSFGETAMYADASVRRARV